MNLTWSALAVVAAGVLGFFYGQSVGNDLCTGREALVREVAAVAVADAASATAQAISRIKVVNTTLRQEIQGEIRTNTVYAACSHAPEQLRRINEALTGDRAEPAGGGELPASGAAR